MDIETLSFEALERRVAVYAPPVPFLGVTPWQRGMFLIGVLGFVVALAGPRLAPGTAGVGIGFIGALVECAAFAAFAFNSLRAEIPEFIEAKRKFAGELDADYEKYLELFAWLRRFPAEELRRRLSYVRRRRDTMTDRFGLLTGGMHRLGVLPLAVALYVQFKDGVGSIGLWEGLLAAALLLLYAMSWWLVGFKLRLDLYVRLLEDAVPRNTKDP